MAETVIDNMEFIPHPTRRTIVVVLVISSVLLAGCSGLGGDSATDSENETNGSNEAAEVNNTTTDPAEANNTSATPEEANNTTDANQTDPPNTDDGDEMNASDSDADESAAPETDSESETNDTTDSNGSQDTADTSGTDETEESDESDETEESDESDESDGTSESDETEESDGATEDTEYASPEDVSVEGVTHMESEAGVEQDEVTLTNTNDEHALPIGGWEIGFEETDQRIPIEEGTVIEPGESHTVQLGDGEKVLNEDGGVVHLYDADGNHVGSWDHIGSPSGPPATDDGGDTGYVQVEVIDAESGEALEDAEVTLEGEGVNEESTGSTDGAGITTVRDLPSGEYELTVEHEGYTSHSETVTVDEEGTEMTVELESSDAGAAALQIVPVGAVSTGSA